MDSCKPVFAPMFGCNFPTAVAVPLCRCATEFEHEICQGVAHGFIGVKTLFASRFLIPEPGCQPSRATEMAAGDR